MTDVKPEDIILESSLLKAMSTRYNFDTFSEFVDMNRLLPNTALLLKDYIKYYDSFDHSTIDWGVFTTEFSQNWHNRDLDQDDIAYYRDTVIPMISNVSDQDVSTTLTGLLDRDYSNRISSLIDSGVDSAKLQNLIDEYNMDRAKYSKDDDEEAFSIDKVDFEVLDKDNGIPWFIPSLQKGIGSLVQGQFVIAAAGHGVGKSAFVISQAVEAFKYLYTNKIDQPILYFNSEGTQADVFTRFLSGLYAKHIPKGFEDVLSRIDEVREKFVQTFNPNNFLVFQIQTGDIAKIKQKVEMYNPSLVIIDIVDVLAPEEDVMTLKKIYDGLRLLSARSCPIIGTTQSGNTSYKYFDKESGKMVVKNRKYLTENDLYGSITGKGGAADTIIAISKDDEMDEVRYIHTPKIKRGRIVKATCELLEDFSHYKEIK